MKPKGSSIRSALLLFPAFILAVSVSNAQTVSTTPPQEVATVAKSSTSNTAAPNAPVFTDYRGIRIGMSAEETRSKLDRLKKGDGQDFLVFSEHESAQIYYDASGKVTAISIDYFGDKNGAPTPEAVLGVPVDAKPDGSLYQLIRYKDAGYWVSYNRTAGDKPIVTITMQKM